jgi:hypothetical protein
MAQLINGPKRWKQFVKSSLSDLQDPTFLTFDIDFFPPKYYLGGDQVALHYDALFKPSLAETDPGKNKFNFVEWPAIDWLMEYGSPWTKTKSDKLMAATVLLNQIQDSPWYFQSITGIDSLWKAASRVKQGDKKAEITINCIDTIQQPLLRFANYYRQAIFDQDRLSYTLPDNLRTFDMTITLFEIRDILDDRGRLTNGLYQLKYRLQRCEFDFDQILSGPTMTEVKAYSTDQPFTTSFKIKADWVIEESEFSTESDYHSLGIFSGIMNTLEGRAQRFLSSAASLPARLIGDLTNRLQTGLETSLAQNVYNRSNEVLSTNEVFGRRSPVGPGGGLSVNDDVYQEDLANPIVTDGQLGDVYP